MRRSFRDDPLYKAIFITYLQYLVKERINIEFFIEGTRSRTNKVMEPRFGITQALTNVYFDKQVEEITFVPINISYTKCLEAESFPNELTGESKVKESFMRVLKAAQVLF